MVSCRSVSKMEIVMSYSRISPRLAISLLILIFLLIPFRQSCRIGYNVRDQLQIAHIVAKVVLFQALEVLILSIAHPRPCTRDLVRENRILSAPLHAVLAPFIRQLVADEDCKQPLMYPLLGVILWRYVSSARSMACSGAMVSSIRSRLTMASHALNGSAFFDGTDWIMRRSCSVLTTSVRRFLPSAAHIFKRDNLSRFHFPLL